MALIPTCNAQNFYTKTTKKIFFFLNMRRTIYSMRRIQQNYTDIATHEKCMRRNSDTKKTQKIEPQICAAYYNVCVAYLSLDSKSQVEHTIFTTKSIYLHNTLKLHTTFRKQLNYISNNTLHSLHNQNDRKLVI